MNHPRATIYGTRAAVSTGHHLASRAALAQLEAGGHLVDAMIAASAVLTVALPHATSLGGCAMALLHDAQSDTLHAVNASGTAPMRATPDVFSGKVDPRGPRSWVTPGLVRLWASAHRRYGRRSWGCLFENAIDLAQSGMGLSSEVARNLALTTPQLRAQPGFDAMFLEADRCRTAGSLWCQPALAQTLHQIAEGGEAAFYAGDIARRLIQFSAKTGGLLDAADLQHIRAIWTQPVMQQYDGVRIATMPPNSVGVLMLAQWQALQAVQHRAREDRLLHQISIAHRLLDRLRDRVADPHAAWPWISEDSGDSYGGDLHPVGMTEPGDTAGIVLADKAGNGLVMLQSVFQPFGSGCVDPDTGILMNNRLGEFSLNPAMHNVLAPGRRPVHTLNPYIAFVDEKPALYAVSPGGVSQTTTGVQFLSNCLRDHMSLPGAIDAARWSLSRDGQVMCEPGFPVAVVDKLQQHGLDVTRDSLHPFYFGSIKAVQRHPHGMLEPAADLRREACAMAW